MNILTGYFSEELEDERPRMRASLANSADEYRAKARDGLAELIARAVCPRTSSGA
jgi:hypothetical protein